MSDRTPLDELLDLVLFAPIGASAEIRRRLPELAEEGRRQVRTQLLTARGIGQFAAARIQRDLPGAVRSVVPGGSPPPRQPRRQADNVVDLHPVEDPPAEPSEDAPTADELPIPDYDALSAVQVVPRLDSLDPDELASVMAYERSHRARRTILHRASELLAAGS